MLEFQFKSIPSNFFVKNINFCGINDGVQSIEHPSRFNFIHNAMVLRHCHCFHERISSDPLIINVPRVYNGNLN